MGQKNLKNVWKPKFFFSINLLVLIFIITALFCIAKTQCPENCLSCSNPTNCTACVSQNNFFMVNASLGCLPCPIRCLKCTSESSLTECVTCSQGYYLDPYLQTCQRCKSPNCLQCNQYFPSECQVCQSSYFLEESTSSCKYCPSEYSGSKSCRENFILTCQDGYYTVNGQVCQKCDSIGGCKTCVSGTVCSQCFDGFYVSSGKCMPCDSTCKTCNTNTSCTSCPKGFRINTSSKCQTCSTANCAACSIQDVCQECSSLYYLDNGNRTCILMDTKKNVQNCLRYASNFNYTITPIFSTSTILCRTCVTGSYLNLETNSCQFCSLLCESCGGMFRSSKCSTCNPLYGLMINSTNGICGAKLFTNTGHKVVYLNSMNDASLFIRSGKTVNFTQGLLKCPGGQLASQVNMTLPNIVGYQFTITVKLLIQTVNSAPFNLSILLNSQKVSSQSITFFQQCNGLKITNFTFSFSVSQLTTNTTSNQPFPINYNQPNIISFKSSLPDDLLIDVREMVVLVKQCHQTCALCDTYQNCIQCKNVTQLLEEQGCVDTCSSGYFYYATKKICLLSCPKGTYPSINSDAWTCQACPVSCAVCTSSTFCTSCESSFYLYSNQCLSSCPATYFKNILFGKCQKCTSPCEQCISTKQCLSCQVGFYLSLNSSCVMSCQDQLYGDFNTMSCKSCKEPCSTCKSESVCLSCTSSLGLSYFGYQCMSSCPSQYFAQQNSQNQSFCQLCQFPCQQCISTPTKCTRCITGYLLAQNNTCVASCPNQYFSSITYLTCTSCQKPCKTCANSQKLCTSCINGYLLMEDKCVISCAEGFYKFNETECRLCKTQCLVCSSVNFCTSCSEGYYLQGQECLTECKDGYFRTETNKSLRVCQKCSDNCKKCFGTSDYCLECYTNFFLKPNNTCSSNCLITQLSPGCSACDYPCYSCSISTSNCTSCVNTYFFSQKTNECVTECYFGFYKSIEEGFGYCRACVLPCTSCQSLSVCYSCSSLNGTTYYLQSQSPTKKVCAKECGVFEYKDDTKLLCLACVQPCLTCTNATYCLSCVNGVLINGNCGSKIDGCPIGSYQIQTVQLLYNGQNKTVATCKACPNRCSSCKSQTVCSGCAMNFYLYQDTCLDYCPSGSTPIKQLRKCIFCEYPCAQCQGTSSNCSKCNQIQLNASEIVCPQERKMGAFCIKYYLMKGECVTQCPSMSFAKGDQCLNCVSPCETCVSEMTCTSCVDGFFILENSCYSTCPNEYYASSITEQCQKCIYPCRTCSDKDRCLSCQEGYLFKEKCLIKDGCPVGYFQNFGNSQNKYCEACDSTCLTCTDSRDYCLECVSLSVHQGICYEKCPNGYYSQAKIYWYLPNTTVTQCVKCPSECLTCKSADFCQSCVFSYSLMGKKCIKRCPPNYMEKFSNFQFSSGINYTVSTCVACVEPCASCFLEETLCQTCLTGFHMYEQKCLTSCPEGTYLNQLTQACKECPFPCKICLQQQKDILCVECSKGYYVENNICVDRCNQKFIDFDAKKCVENCDGGYMVKHISTQTDFCLRQCQFPYLTDETNKRCVVNCSQNQYITADYSCVSFTKEVEKLIPKLRNHLFVDSRGILNLYVEITRDVQFTDALPLQENIQISLQNYKEHNSLNSYRLLQQETTAFNEISSFPITFSLIRQSSSLLIFQLYPTKSVYFSSFVSLNFKSNSHLYVVDEVSKLPLQSSSSKLQLKEGEFYEVCDYILVKKNKFAYVGEIIMDFALILGLAMALFNKFAKVYHFLVFGQSVFMLVCLDIPMPPNLYRFLQGFKYSHFYQLGNWFDMLERDQRYTDFYGNNLNRIESIFGDLAFIKVTGHMIGLYCIVVVVGLVLYGVRYIPETRNSYVNRILSLMADKSRHVKWSHLTDIFVSTFMLIVAGFAFQTQDYTTVKTEQVVSIALSYIVLLLLASFGVYFFYKTYKMETQSQKEPRKFVQKGYMHREEYASFYQGISSPQNSYKNYMLLGKIIAYGGLCGFLWRYPNFCLSVWMVLEVVYGVIYVRFRPFADDVQNYIYGGCGFVYGLAMVLMIVVNQCQKPASTFFIPQSQQSRKILIGYFIIVLVLVCTFVLIVEIIISVMRGSLKPRKLEGEQEEYNQVKQSSPNGLEVKKILDQGPKKIVYEAKREYKGYEIQSFDKRRDRKHMMTVKKD